MVEPTHNGNLTPSNKLKLNQGGPQRKTCPKIWIVADRLKISTFMAGYL